MESKLKPAFAKEDAYLNLDRVNGWISSCDTKASILFGVLGVIIGLTTEVFKVFGFLKNICSGVIESSWGNITLLIFQMLLITSYIVATIFAVYNLVNVLKARVQPSMRKEVKKSILHFWSISERNDDEFLLACKEIDDDELIQDINKQVWINSKICNTKYRYQKRALGWILVTGAMAIGALILVNLI